MKLIISILFSITCFNAFANINNEYRKNKDGSLTYIGSCLLHEDYNDIKFDAVEIVPYTEYPTAKFFKSLTPLQKKLAIYVYQEELEMSPDDEPFDLDGFDDISFDLIKIKKSTRTLYRVNYGVGNGNGGHTTFRVLSSEKVEVVTRTFDGDLLYCHKDFDSSLN